MTEEDALRALFGFTPADRKSLELKLERLQAAGGLKVGAQISLTEGELACFRSHAYDHKRLRTTNE